MWVGVQVRSCERGAPEDGVHTHRLHPAPAPPRSPLETGVVRRIQASLLPVRFLTSRLASRPLGCWCDFL